jgi:hypothetical protein
MYASSAPLSNRSRGPSDSAGTLPKGLTCSRGVCAHTTRAKMMMMVMMMVMMMMTTR